MVKQIGEKIFQVLDGQILPNEKLAAERVKLELIVIFDHYYFLGSIVLTLENNFKNS